MKTICLCALAGSVMILGSPAFGGFLDDVLKGAKLPQRENVTNAGQPDQKTTISGLKEALSIGTEKAVASVSRTDGYFGNNLIKILLPEKVQKVADIVGKLGYQPQVDNLILAMNRAAETAAPKATSLFVEAIKQMTFDDGMKILRGGNTAATDYFRGKTSQRLYEQFRPIVSSSMDKVGVARSYKEMMAPYQSMPFASKDSTDLDHYVTNKALDGLFLMVAEEEKNIRTNPAARVTDLLKKVFGN